MRAKSVQDLSRIVDERLKQLQITSPGAVRLKQLFDVLFFATLKTEEGKPLQCRVVLVDPQNPDPHRPPRPRPHRWIITPLKARLPLTVPTLVKLSKAVDPWNSSLATYHDNKAGFFVWGLVDQAVQFNTMLVRESDTGYGLPGTFQVLAAGPADLSVHADFHLIARLQQEAISKAQSDVFWSGPVSNCIDNPMQRYLKNAFTKAGPPGDLTEDETEDEIGTHVSAMANEWIRTVCRTLISIQRYRHGGALLLTRGRSHLDIKYGINYDRLPKALCNLGVARIKKHRARIRILEYLRSADKSLPIGLYREQTIQGAAEEDYASEITGCIRFISSLSYVDGLILATPDLAIRGFGAEIRTKLDPPKVFLSTHPSGRENSLQRIDPQHYGMRHRSMMRYCFAHPSSLGFVVSQDGDLRAMTRVRDAVYMWDNLKVLGFSEAEVRRQSRSKAPK